MLNAYYGRYKEVHDIQKETGSISKDDPGLSLNEFEAGLKNRAKHSEMILNSIVTYFASNARNSYSKVNIYGQGSEASTYHSEMLPVHAAENKQRLERHIVANLHQGDGSIADRYLDVFGFNAERKVYSPVYEPGEAKKDSIFYLASDGLYLALNKGYGKTVRVIGIENGQFVPINKTEIENYLTDNNSNDSFRDVLKKIFQYYLNYGDINPIVLKRLSEKKTSNDNYGIEDVHEILGPLILSAYTYAADKAFSRETINQRHELYGVST